MYVRKGYAEKAFRAIKAWKDFMEVAKALTELKLRGIFKGDERFFFYKGRR